MDFLTNLGVPVWSLVKTAVLFALLIYIVFAVVVVKQVRLMTETLEVEFGRVIKVASYAHLIFAFAVFVLAIIVL